MPHSTVTVAARSRAPRLRAAIALLIAAVALTGCAATPAVTSATSSTASETLLEDYGLSGLDAREIIDRLDQTPIDDRPDGLTAQIRTEELVLGDADGAEVVLPLPEEQSYIAFAPYLTETHDCTYHAPVGCLGELRDTAVRLSITDQANGEVYYDAETRTFDNGFIGVWLPRGVDANVIITANGRRAEAVVSTSDADAATCITAPQLI